MSKALNLCKLAVDEFGNCESSAHFLLTLRRSIDMLDESDPEINARQKIRAIAKLKNSLAIFLIANRDVIMKPLMHHNMYERFAIGWKDVVGTLERAVETMPKHKGRGFNARLSTALGGLSYCIAEAERELIAYSPKRKKSIEKEQWNDLFIIERNIYSARMERKGD